MTPELFRSLVAKAQLAPSVHNVQPARWRLTGHRVELWEDTKTRLPAADPNGHDAAISLGAAFEGMVIAAADHGLSVSSDDSDERTDNGLRHVKSLSFSEGGGADPLSAFVDTRKSWRGSYSAATDDDRARAAALQTDDCSVVQDPSSLTALAKAVDAASFGFLQKPDFRSELISWMRLRKGHPNWGRDGLNADAMNLGRFERLGAAIVMGPAFRLLDKVGAAAPLLSESDKTGSASAIVLFHRPEEEDPFDSGRAFYRAWLRIEAAGFSAAVLAALADDPDAAEYARGIGNVPDGQRLVSAFRIGRPLDHTQVARARVPVEDVIV